MLLTFSSRHQMMYNVSYVVLCAEVTYKGSSLVSDSRVSKHNFYSFFLNLSTLLYCINLEIIPCWR